MTEQHKNTSLQNSFTEARDAAAALEERVSHLVDLSVQRLEGLGKIGQEFVTALNDSGVHIVCDENVQGRKAYYHSYLYPVGFQNYMKIGVAALEDDIAFMTDFIHEGVHAIQMANVAALHACAGNDKSNIRLAPASQIHVMELMEADAYSKEAHLMHRFIESLDAADRPAVIARANQSMRYDFLMQLKSLCDENYTRALFGFGMNILKQEFRNAPIRGIDKYHNDFFMGHAVVTERELVERDDIIFCRIDEEDMKDIGNAFGPNLFMPNGQDVHDHYASPLPMLMEYEDELERLGSRVGTDNEAALPTFSQCLAQQGLTKQDFLDQVEPVAADDLYLDTSDPAIPEPKIGDYKPL
ncbi:MAG: hypothetical protein QF692_03920 [Alphaproteobacteria bacterium]|jgi:hypothetical protein|nr:hypothetical protein [Alphaproteobacteria bacterium]MDP7222394.1 hypothetical protein [Alphaproteobacteria bacterium]